MVGNRCGGAVSRCASLDQSVAMPLVAQWNAAHFTSTPQESEPCASTHRTCKNTPRGTVDS
ncbi:unannotated protein [freshwater metagenome]|jgi:hypothetical protein|uniref:Unannotated protein n=1 Tax=freshwater metagenome TaxID=449393 RepID=A0A6J7IHN8_9ZZZZ|nr:hypothetical protein VF34_03161 [Rhodococcus sp. PML026]